MTKYAVLGAGHGGKAMAAIICSMGNYVSLWNRSEEHISRIMADNKLYVDFHPGMEKKLYLDPKDAELKPKKLVTVEDMHRKGLKDKFIRGTTELNKVSSYIEEIFQGDDKPDVIMVAIPARGHKYIAKTIAPHLSDGQVILLNPGRTFGALEFHQTIKNYYKKKKKDMPDITIGEAATFVYASRSDAEKYVRIHGVKESVNVSAIPANKTKNIINSTKNVYSQFRKVKNVLYTSLENIGGVLHVPITIINANRIGDKEEFLFYTEGLNDATIGWVNDVDQERVQVADAMDVKVRDLRGWLKYTYGPESEGATPLEAIQNTNAYKDLMGPTSLNVRYLWEDVPCSLIPIISLGKKLGVECPMSESYINKARSAIVKSTKNDLFEEARTMKNLGLDKLNKRQIIKYMETGKHPLGDI